MILLHRLHLILLSGVLVALVFFTYTSVAIKPVYSTSSMIFIQNYGKQQKEQDDKQALAEAQGGDSSKSDAAQSNNQIAQKIFNSDISGSSSLAKICVTLFQNSDEITSLYDGCSVNISVMENTFYIVISVSGHDPQKCADVSNAIATEAQAVFTKWFDYGKIGTIRSAGVPGSPISPNKPQNTIIGFAIGVIVACVIAILLELIDTTIKGNDDLASIYKVPVFAEIPDFEGSGR